MLRAAALYIAAVWAIPQGTSQLSGPLGLANAVTVWFLIACAIGFPFWIAFAWFYEVTPQGIKRESELERDQSITHRTGRKLNYWIIGVLAVAVVLPLTNQLILHRRETLHEFAGALVAPGAPTPAAFNPPPPPSRCCPSRTSTALRASNTSATASPRNSPTPSARTPRSP